MVLVPRHSFKRYNTVVSPLSLASALNKFKTCEDTRDKLVYSHSCAFITFEQENSENEALTTPFVRYIRFHSSNISVSGSKIRNKCFIPLNEYCVSMRKIMLSDFEIFVYQLNGR